MCNRFTMAYSEEELQQFLGLDEIDESLGFPRYNVAPTQSIPVVRRSPVGAIELVGMKWGLVPAWAKAGSAAAGGFLNARWETVGEKPAFRDSANRRRCAIPADGYIEWSTEGRAKKPHWFRLPARRIFLFAGLWEPGAPDTAAILTTAANDDTREFHDRMPVLIERKDLDDWLNESKGWDTFREACPTLPPGAVTNMPIHPRINSSKGEDKAWLTEYRDTLFG
jgi:putative SOS response-associated peptidase YedK